MSAMSRRKPIILDSSDSEGFSDVDALSAMEIPQKREQLQLQTSNGRVLQRPVNSNRFENAGAASIADMREHAAEDRISILAFVKEANLLDVRGSPRDLYMRTLWKNRLEAFMQDILLKTKITMPNTEELQMFLVEMTLCARPTPDRVPSYKWLVGARESVVAVCKSNFREFALSEYDELLLDKVIAQLLKCGNVTKDPIREKQWIGATVVRQLIEGLVMRAHIHGTISWDITLAKWLSIIFVSALACRVGDVMTSIFDEHDLPFLAYQDIKITINEGGSGLADLTAVVVIRNEKGHKDEPDNNRIVLLKSLRSAKDALMDPIMLLLVIALRFGEVFEDSIDELLVNVRARHDRTVVWRNPRHPVFCKFYSPGSAVAIGEAAWINQLSSSLQDAAVAAGITTPLAAHDLRRGAARDTAHSNNETRGVATTSVQASIGHAQNSRNLHLTSKYVGQAAVDRYSARVGEPFIDPIYKVSINENTKCNRKDKQLAPDDITRFCEENGLEKNDPQCRKKASMLISKRRLEDSRDNANKRPRSGDTDDSDESLDECLTSALDGVSSESLAAGPHQAERIHFTEDHLSFIRGYSRINVSTNYTLGSTRVSADDERELLFARIDGNSRDKPSQFVHRCRNARFGCTHTTTIYPELHRHERICRYISQEAAAEISAQHAKKLIPCHLCDKVFETEKELFDHTRKGHDWKPRSCDRAECDSTVIYQTDYEWKKHLDTHGNFPPTRCQVPQCKSNNVFQKANTLRKHLREAHKLKGKDADVYLPTEYKSTRGKR